MKLQFFQNLVGIHTLCTQTVVPLSDKGENGPQKTMEL